MFDRKARGRGASWDLTALLNAADAKAALPERHLWLIRLMEWLRHAPLGSATGTPPGPATTTPAATAASPTEPAAASLPLPVRRLKHLLNVLDRSEQHRREVAGLLGRFWLEIDMISLFADFGFAGHMDFFGELGQRLRHRLLPMTPATQDLGQLFGLLFPHGQDASWLEAIDAPTMERVVALVAPALGARSDGRTRLLDAILFLCGTVGAAGFSSTLRLRMSKELLAEKPFRQLTRVAERLSEHAEAGDTPALLREAQYLRALLQTCRRSADSVNEHLEEHGVSVDVVFEADQLRERTHRIEELLNCVLSQQPAQDIAALLVHLAHRAEERRRVRGLFSRHYSLLARKVAERSAETGEHYITRDRSQYRAMLRAAFGGGSVIGITTFLKFFITALGLSAFWSGFWAGVNYAASFVFVQLMHWTVATKQPAMTAPAMASRLGDVSTDNKVERFVDEVSHLIRSQAAGIFGNLAAVVPVVLAVQLACQAAFGAPPVGPAQAEHVLHSLSLLGPTALFAAFTGVLLFTSSLIAGWAENWFVWHRLDSAIAWNPRFIAVLGAARARRWGAYWRANISGYAANISLGLMLGLVPSVALFFGLPLEVRHVTLSAGQLAAAAGAQGLGLLREAPFWWCVAGTAVTAVLNISVSFFLAFKLAMRSQGIRLADRSRIYAAIRRRLWQRPASFLVPPRDPGAAA